MVKTYNDIYIAAKKRLKAAASGESLEEINAAAAVEARLILAFAAEKSTEEFTRDIRLFVGEDYEKRAWELIERRAAGEPAAYIIGGWEFYGLPMTVSPGVLIPRVDTETVAAAAIDIAKGLKAPRVLDLCCGSGCIGIALASHVPDSRVSLADFSDTALKAARHNALINKVSPRCFCLSANALEAPERVFSDFDLLVSNPPYIPSADIAGLDVSVREYEPRLALDGGTDGLDFYRAICEKWQRAVKKGGYFVFECGINQADEVLKIGESFGLEPVEKIEDTINIERAAVLRKT